jgi:anti-sigma regulatory factor (Ser/Thr protein kinase)
MVQFNGSQATKYESSRAGLWQDGLAPGADLGVPAGVRVAIVYDEDVLEVRSKARELGLSLGFSNRAIVSTVATVAELARKIFQSGRPGEVALTVVDEAKSYGIVVSARGEGLGVADNGPDLIRVLQLMDEFSVLYDKHEGLTAVSKKMAYGWPHHSSQNGS